MLKNNTSRFKRSFDRLDKICEDSVAVGLIQSEKPQIKS